MVLHVTTFDEILLLSRRGVGTAVETTPQHLTLSAPECYERLGTGVRMNPPIRYDEKPSPGAVGSRARWAIDGIGNDGVASSRARVCARRNILIRPRACPGCRPSHDDPSNSAPPRGPPTLERFIDLTAIALQRIFGIAGKGQHYARLPCRLHHRGSGPDLHHREQWIARPVAGHCSTRMNMATSIRFVATILCGGIVIK